MDKERGLTGVCDYLLARSPERFFLSHPVVAVVEAKREDITGGRVSPICRSRYSCHEALTSAVSMDPNPYEVAEPELLRGLRL